KDFICRRICGETLLMPVGEKTREFNGIFTLTETGAFLMDEIERGSDEEQAALNLAEEFETDIETARQDADEFFEQLRAYGIITDE
nr:PqqD family protein [Clostridia bacterium]